jgi:hypothetical protein
MVDGEPVVAGGDAAPVLEAAEGALDQVAQPAGERIERVAALAGRVVGDDRQRATGDRELPQGVAVVGGVGDAQPGGRQRFDERRRDRQVVPMAGAQREGERPDPGPPAQVTSAASRAPRPAMTYSPMWWVGACGWAAVGGRPSSSVAASDRS